MTEPTNKGPRGVIKALAALLPLGAMGVSVALAAAPARPIAPPDAAAGNVAGRLQAIRAAVTEITADQAGLQPGDPDIQKAWWANWRPGWFNGGWRNWRNGWNNWNNWRNNWFNGGWNNFWRNW